jgi:hypothetical protein
MPVSLGAERAACTVSLQQIMSAVHTVQRVSLHSSGPKHSATGGTRLYQTDANANVSKRPLQIQRPLSRARLLLFDSQNAPCAPDMTALPVGTQCIVCTPLPRAPIAGETCSRTAARQRQAETRDMAASGLAFPTCRHR